MESKWITFQALRQLGKLLPLCLASCILSKKKNTIVVGKLWVLLLNSKNIDMTKYSSIKNVETIYNFSLIAEYIGKSLNFFVSLVRC